MLLAMLCASVSASAYDFEASGVKYTISSLTELTVAVDGVFNEDTTLLDIPQTVEYRGKTLTVTSIAAEALKDLKQLSAVSLPQTILSIGAEAFSGDTCLRSIILPDSLHTLEEGAFRDCTSLKSISIPNGITSISNELFYGCSSLKTVSLNNNITTIGIRAFKKSGIESIELPNSIQQIEHQAFSASMLKAIELPTSITYIKSYCFEDCVNLIDITLHAKEIDSYAFRNCTSLTTINLPQNLESINVDAFRGCTNLLEFSIPSSVTNISPSILWDCPNLNKLTIGNGLTGLPHYHTQYSGRDCSTLGSYNYYGRDDCNKTYLQGLKKVIIEDSDTPFSIKGFIVNDSLIPAFANIDLDYFYVGRPLKDINSMGKGYICNYYEGWQKGRGHITTLEIAGGCNYNHYFYQRVDTLILGANINLFIPNNVYANDLKKVVCLSTVPPNIQDDEDMAFPTNVYVDAVLYVPTGCKNTYSSAVGWRNFWNIEEIDKPTHIELQSVDTDNYTVDVYSIQGTLIKKNIYLYDLGELPKGLYIIASGKGSKKIVI